MALSMTVEEVTIRLLEVRRTCRLWKAAKICNGLLFTA